MNRLSDKKCNFNFTKQKKTKTKNPALITQEKKAISDAVGCFATRGQTIYMTNDIMRWKRYFFYFFGPVG